MRLKFEAESVYTVLIWLFNKTIKRQAFLKSAVPTVGRNKKIVCIISHVNINGDFDLKFDSVEFSGSLNRLLTLVG